MICRYDEGTVSARVHTDRHGACVVRDAGEVERCET